MHFNLHRASHSSTVANPRKCMSINRSANIMICANKNVLFEMFIDKYQITSFNQRAVLLRCFGIHVTALYM